MIAPNHITTGAVIALSVSQPVVALLASYVSHFVLDALPHFGPKNSSNVFERNKQLSFKIYVFLGVALSLILIPSLFIFLSGEVSFWLLAGCILFANLPDFVWIPRFVYEIKTKKELPKGKFSRFHSWVQKLDKPWGWTVELVWFCLSIYVIFRIL